MTDHYQVEGAVVTVTIDRSSVRNAVDPESAAALADCFRRFATDEKLAVAILTGAGGNFCAGFDLRSMASGTPNRLSEDGDGPLGPTRLELDKPVIAAIEGYAVAGGSSWRCGATSGSPPAMPPWASSTAASACR